MFKAKSILQLMLKQKRNTS